MMPVDPIVGSTILRRPAIQSPNYVKGSTGWTINVDGSAEFNNLTIRGTFAGTDFIINSTGLFLYSGVPALGNLALSLVPGSTTVTDPEGNTAQPGLTSYSSANVFAQLLVAALSFQSAAGQPVLAGVVSSAAGAIAVTSGTVGAGDSVAELLIESAQANDGANRLLELIGEQLLIPPVILAVVGGTVTIQNNVTITGTLSVNGSTSTAGPSNNNTSTNGLTNGQIAGTSGAASAGTAHTHGPGSYAVTNGQHAHNLNSHLHVL